MYLVIGYNPEMEPGQRLPPEVRAEIALLAPATVTPNSIVEDKLANGAVSRDKIKEKAVDGTRMADGAVSTEQLALGAVDTDRLKQGAVTGEKAGIGIAKAFDPAGSPISFRVVPITSTGYQSLPTVDPSTLYLISG